MKIVDMPPREKGPDSAEWYDRLRELLAEGFQWYSDAELVGMLEIVKNHILTWEDEEDE